ncbi:acyltransferase family protein [Nocardia transvalensis]|uniref:acyltransferase family protein n=1 Tax=Nocardia transvalensis TaxID=37333 RepID=UPI001895B967|nr:acyltransferase [Nocardia transvalensis]MBF6329815.1 acyltransferase [Nocardia transvalensis]
MRWLAAALVFFHHAVLGTFPVAVFGDGLGFAAAPAAAVGVSFFFILSGFVLTWSARPDDTARRFWRRRFFKIYPNHVVTFIAVVALLMWMQAPIVGVVPNLLLVHAWPPDLNVVFGVNAVSWSLACEVLFYSTFPVWLALTNRIRPNWLWFGAGAVALLVFCVPLAAELFPAGPESAWAPGTSDERYWFVYAFPPVRLLEFILGIMLARIVQTGRWINIGLWIPAILLVIGYVAALHVPFLFSLAAATVIPLALLIPAAAAADVRGRQSFLGSPVMVWLGTISFAFYLIHLAVLVGLSYAVGPEYPWTPGTAAGLVAIALAVSIVMSWLLHTLVERPIQRRFSTPRARVTNAPTARQEP